MDKTELIKTYPFEFKIRFMDKEIGEFSSKINGTANKKSDSDIVIEFEKEGETFNNFMELKFYLEKIFKKKMVLLAKKLLKEEIRENI
ncbi:MAG: nucleotidyltransferase domain-containing protein [Candidatus Saccharicenans sp.]